MNFNVLNDDGSVKTIEQIEKEEALRQQMLEEFVEYGSNAVLFFFRWPFALIWKYRQPNWFFHQLPELQAFGFTLLLVVGALAEIFALWFSFGERIWYLNALGPLPHPGVAMLSWITLLFLTIVRIVVWQQYECKD